MSEITVNSPLRDSYRKQGVAEYYREWPSETQRISRYFFELSPTGIFATGIENSDPWVDGDRRNQLLEAHDFPKNFESRLENIRRLGISYLRFGAGYSTVHLGPDQYDFSLTDQVLDKCHKLGITVIADLMHFGLPEWLHADNPETPFYQNESFPIYFAEYAKVFAKRYPQISFYTPVNEPTVTARFSAKDGFWNEKILTEWYDHRPYVRALSNVARAAILARQAIENVWQEENRQAELVFFQNDSFEAIHATFDSEQKDWHTGFNTQRFAPTDLIFGHQDLKQKEYLLEHGMKEEEYHWFMENGTKERTVLGIDYYPWNIHRFTKAGKVGGDPTLAEGIHFLVTDYWKRYQMPFMHMEINAPVERAVDICLRTYESLRALREVGYPILGMTWYGDELQVGWPSLLLGEGAFDEHRVGLFYKGQLESVGATFSRLAKSGFPPLLPQS